MDAISYPARQMSRDASITEELARLRASEARLIAFAEGARRLLGVTDPKALVDEVLALAQQSVAADGYAVWRREDDTWRVAAASGMDASFAGLELPTEQDLPLTGPMVAEDVTTTPMLESRREAYAKSGVRSLVAVPLEIRGRPGGSIVYYHRERHRPQPIELKIDRSPSACGRRWPPPRWRDSRRARRSALACRRSTRWSHRALRGTPSSRKPICSCIKPRKRAGTA